MIYGLSLWELVLSLAKRTNLKDSDRLIVTLIDVIKNKQ